MNDIVRLPRSAGYCGTIAETLPTDPDIERSFRDVLRWMGEDPERDGLRETPGRVMRAFQEYFSGYL